MDALRGRGTPENPANRFDRIDYAWDEDADPSERLAPGTVLLRDSSRSVIAYNDSPDLGFRASINPYRGCEHGCPYCYARPTHEYLGFSAGLDFETRILIKENAPTLLRQELASARWEPQVVMMSGNTDCYQPAERGLQITRRCLEVFVECRNPVAAISKSGLIARDADLYGELAKFGAAAVSLSITTLDSELQRILEPRAAHPQRRLDALATLAAAGVPVSVMVAPVIPGINDHEILAIIKAAADAGARSAGFVVIRLPHGVKGLFEAWLQRHFPERKEKVLSQIRDMRGGKLYDSSWGSRQRGEGGFADNIGSLFRLACRKAGFAERQPRLSAEHFIRPRGPQLELF